MKLTKFQEAAIIGMILGDGYLQKTGKRNARLRLEHKADHKEYLVWKTQILPQLFQGKPSRLNRIHPKTKREYKYIRHQSNSSPVLGKLQRIFYPSGKKIIPKNLAQYLKSDIALAIWYYDDGYYYPRDNCAYIYLGRVSRMEAEIAKNALFEKFKIFLKILDKKHKGFALYVSPKDIESFMERIQKYRIPIMSYKLSS